MNQIALILTVINFLGLIYLLYLILTKYRYISSQKNDNFSGIQKVNLIRFNPFEDIGGDQSFILVLLDKDNSGLLLTSLHHRSFSRIYAKPIKNGQGDNITLSKEEKSAILKTISR
jgi:hypothetical protein